MTFPGDGDELFRMNGAGENLTWSAVTLKISMSHVRIYQKNGR